MRNTKTGGGNVSKVVMLGDTNVGKTSLVLRFAEGYYRDEGRSATVGAFFITKRIQTTSGITCKVQIWDTAGQNQYRKMAPMYYRTAAAAIICYDMTNPQSFDVMREWVDELQETLPPQSIAMVIAATKADLAEAPLPSSVPEDGNDDERRVRREVVSHQKGRTYAESVGAVFVNTSSRTNEGVHLLFRKISEEVLEMRERARNNGVGGGGVGGPRDGLLLTPRASRASAIGSNGTGPPSGVRGGDAAAGDGSANGSAGAGVGLDNVEANRKRALSDSYGEGGAGAGMGNSPPRDVGAGTVDEWEEKMAKERDVEGLCSPFGCTADEKVGDTSCRII